MRKIILLLLITTASLLTGCATPNYVTKQAAYPLMYQQHPLSILVVPAINHSTAADAPELYSTTIATPLAEAGYYVLPLPITNMLLQQQGVVDGEQLEKVDATKFQGLFGADAILFVTINQWDTNYYITGGNVTVGAAFRLVSTKDNEELWHYSQTIVYDTSGNSGGGLLAAIISTAISTATTDYVPIARTVNGIVVNTLPAGKYSPHYDKDGAVTILEQKQVN
ncbi:GNA1162 family protein [Shewanella sp.]|uniref:GNA1162 family protein n=1 Tax=Shewanella sp. TaxID=50422 RepID=UPI003D113D7F